MDKRIKILKQGEIGTRPTWDEYFMKWALDIASRSTCFNVHAGSVIILNKRLIGSGYNGAPMGVESCLERGGCFKELKTGKEYSETMNSGRCIGVHSEMNALAHLSGLFNRGATLYVTIFPCTSRTKNLLAYGIKRVVFKRIYDEQEMGLALDLFQEADVEICQLDLSPERYLDIAFNHPDVEFDVWENEEKQKIKNCFENSFEEENTSQTKEIEKPKLDLNLNNPSQ